MGMISEKKAASAVAAASSPVKTLQSQINLMQNEIKAKIGSASVAVCGAYKVSFKEQATSGIDRKKIAEDFPSLDFKQYATRARVLRVSSPKEKSA